ncbi:MULTISPECIES: hypothetical protein [Bacillus cereus group]|uniref:hypothetical protein n=1 Tax=Bacillus cereus group TaxID=86661 RepID=UPI001C0284FF|nr:MULTISPECIES: hypothetical protein [Bacillus cereus group]QWG48133.1 hypothetical protein EXW31_28610 [Bacillus mycoides]WJE23076.1 hypothetical protein QRE65_00155 [Bacillus cereus]
MEVKNGVFYQTPAIGKDGTIYVYSTYGSSLEAYNPDGSLKWKSNSMLGRSTLYSTGNLIAADGTIYTGVKNDGIHVLNPDGTLKWKVDLSSSQATFSNNNSLTMDQLGNLYLFAQELEDNNSKSYKRCPSSIPRTSPSFYNF